MRTTKKDLETRVKMINSHLGISEDVIRFDLEYSYGGVKLVKTYHGGGIINLSTRMSKKEMWNALCVLEDSILHFGLMVE